MNTKTLYRMYNIETDSISLSESNYASWLDSYILLSEIQVEYSDGLSPYDTTKLEEKLETTKTKLLAKAQLVQEKLNTLRCIDYSPVKNSHMEGAYEEPRGTNEEDGGVA